MPRGVPEQGPVPIPYGNPSGLVEKFLVLGIARRRGADPGVSRLAPLMPQPT
jgi:hypothetical protein